MRRVVALIVLLLDVYVGVHHEAFGMLGPVVALCAVLVAIFAGAMVIFNLPLQRTEPPQDGGSGMSESIEFGVGVLGLLAFSLGPLFIAARGIYRGYLPALGSGPDIRLLQRPGAFLLNLGFWGALGLVVLWLLYKSVAARQQAKEDAGDA